MGVELDVIVGHPEHDLLFVATQVARAAGRLVVRVYGAKVDQRVA
ncbi:hypothetical protein [Pseudomonas fragi]|nr:hypothetical protein [Pseudomonas fragi]